MKAKSCSHLDNVQEVKKGETYECAECTKMGDKWVHLRTCQSCGTTLCCDSSPNKHATAHFKQEGHPVVSSAEPEEQWLWCYKDELFRMY